MEGFLCFHDAGFLIGAGSLLTAAFYWYNNGNGLLLTIGAYQLEPPPPTWREFFISEGIAHTTDDEAYLVWADHSIWPEHYDEPMDDRYWQDFFDLESGPCAKAYRLLDGLELGPDLQSARQGPHLGFVEGAYPGDNSRWVEASGKLALSLLQARLIDLKLPISVRTGHLMP